MITDTETPISNVEFTLTQVDSNKHFVTDENNKPITQVGRTSTTGELTFEGLTPGAWYMLDETEMPAGYIKTESPYYIHINEDGSGALDTTVAHALISPESGNEYTVGNTPGTALPNTGGPGTGLFTMIGGILSATAGAILTLTPCRRRKKQYT